MDSCNLEENARAFITRKLNELDEELFGVNSTIHTNPELAYQEVTAHNTISNFLEKQGYQVKRGAYGLSTCFETSLEVQRDGQEESLPEIVFCAEYDALPEIGHACGHNLIATSSLAAFTAAAAALSELGIPGKIRLLGTPAEESGGGKDQLLSAGAFDPPSSIAAAIMAHPMPMQHINTSADDTKSGYTGLAGFKLIASQALRAEFQGRTAHAGGEPWMGRNALDAAVASYANVALLRQHIRPDDRIHGVFEDGGKAANIIPDYTRMSWLIRSPTADRRDVLTERVQSCFQAGAAAAGCEYTCTKLHAYKNLRANNSLCRLYVDEMMAIGQPIKFMADKPVTASTDMGNVSHYVPSFHGAIGIKCSPGVAIHSPQFTAAAGTREAHAAALYAGKGMAMMAIRLLLDTVLADNARADFLHKDE